MGGYSLLDTRTESGRGPGLGSDGEAPSPVEPAHLAVTLSVAVPTRQAAGEVGVVPSVGCACARSGRLGTHVPPRALCRTMGQQNASGISTSGQRGLRAETSTALGPRERRRERGANHLNLPPALAVGRFRLRSKVRGSGYLTRACWVHPLLSFRVLLKNPAQHGIASKQSVRA